MFYDSTYAVAYDAQVDSTTGLFGRRMPQNSICARGMVVKARYRIEADTIWRESAFQPLLDPMPSVCPDTAKASDIVIVPS